MQVSQEPNKFFMLEARVAIFSKEILHQTTIFHGISNFQSNALPISMFHPLSVIWSHQRHDLLKLLPFNLSECKKCNHAQVTNGWNKDVYINVEYSLIPNKAPRILATLFVQYTTGCRFWITGSKEYEHREKDTHSHTRTHHMSLQTKKTIYLLTMKDKWNIPSKIGRARNKTVNDSNANKIDKKMICLRKMKITKVLWCLPVIVQVKHLKCCREAWLRNTQEGHKENISVKRRKRLHKYRYALHLPDRILV